MSGKNIENPKETGVVDSSLRNPVEGEEPIKETEQLAKNDENLMKLEEQEAIIKTKYGGIIPRKPPLISKDHERAFFDSADWALGKQGAQKPKGPLEALRPKLQPTPNQQVRSKRSAYAPSDEVEDEGNDDNPTSEDQGRTIDGGSNNESTTEEKKSLE